MKMNLSEQDSGENNMERSLKDKTVSSLIWKFIEKFGAQLMQFVVSIVLARLLMPEDYGIIAITTVFLAIANVFVDSGFSSILIRKLDADDLDYSTVFYFTLGVSIVLYLLFFFILAPLLSKLYDQPQLIPVLRALALVLIMSSYNSMQKTILSKKLLFRRLFLSTFSATCFSSAVGIALAYYGYGVWALVAQQLTSTGVSMIVMTFTVRWRPKFIFSFNRLKALYSLGWKFFTVSLINVTYDNLHSMVIGKKYDETALAYWSKGRQFPGLIVDNINGTVGSVMYPVLSQKQDEPESLKRILRTDIKTVTYLIWPMMIGLIVCSDSVIRFLLGEKWIQSAYYMRMFCIYFSLIPITTIDQILFQVMGKGKLLLVTEIAKKLCGLSILVTTLFFGLKWVAIGLVLDSALSFIIATLPCKKLINYGILDIVKDVLPNLLVCGIMGICVYSLSFIKIDYRLILFIQIFTGIMLYILLSWIFRLSSFKWIINYIKQGIGKIKSMITHNKFNNPPSENKSNSMSMQDGKIEEKEINDTENASKIDNVNSNDGNNDKTE